MLHRLHKATNLFADMLGRLCLLGVLLSTQIVSTQAYAGSTYFYLVRWVEGASDDGRPRPNFIHNSQAKAIAEKSRLDLFC